MIALHHGHQYEIIVSEESDVSLDGASYKSHFEIYIDAMDEVGANTAPVRAFLELVRREGVDLALARATMPEAARRFVTTTMSFVHSGKPWVIGAAFTYGREDVIPDMFRGLIDTPLSDKISRHTLQACDWKGLLELIERIRACPTLQQARNP
jgi:DUF3050 family protein